MPKIREFEPVYSSSLGLKQSHAETNMPYGALLDVSNMNLNGIGGKTARQGYREYFHLTNGLGGARVHNRIRSLVQYRPSSGTNQTLAYAGTVIYQKNPSGTDTSLVRSTLANDVRWNFVQYNDFIHGVNGSNTSFLYNGSNWVTISLTGVGAHVNLAAQAGGALEDTKTYEYLTTRYDATRARESAPFTVATAPSLTIAAPNQTIRLSNPPAAIADEGMTHWRVYRRKTGETNFTLTATVPIASATYDDTGDPTGTTVLEVDDGTIDNGYTAHVQSSLIEEAFDRVFMVSGTLLLFSQPGGKSFAWPSANFLPIGRNDGSPIVGLHRHGEALVIHKRNSWWILDGDPATTTPRRLSGVGTQDVGCSSSDDNVIFRLSPKGFYLSKPTQFDANDLREEYIGRDVVNDESQIDWANTNLVSTVSYRSKTSRHMYAMFPSTASLATSVLVYHTLYNEWTKYQLGTDVFSAAPYQLNGATNLMLGDGYGMVWTWDVGSTDGTSLTSELLNGTFTATAAGSFTDTSKIDDSGTASAGGASTLTDSSKTWTVDEWANKQLYIVAGTGSGQYRTITTNTATVLTVDSAWAVQPDATSQYQIGGWPVDGLVGVLVTTRTGLGGGQRRRIASNTPTTATLTANWGTTPDTSTTYSIGAIAQFGEEFWDNAGDPHVWKRMRWIIPYVAQDGDFIVTLKFRKDFRRGSDSTITAGLNVTGDESLWGQFLWGQGNWASASTAPRRIRLRGKYRYYSVRYENNTAAQPFNWNGHGAVFQRLYDRNG